MSKEKNVNDEENKLPIKKRYFFIFITVIVAIILGYFIFNLVFVK